MASRTAELASYTPAEALGGRPLRWRVCRRALLHGALLHGASTVIDDLRSPRLQQAGGPDGPCH